MVTNTQIFQAKSGAGDQIVNSSNITNNNGNNDRRVDGDFKRANEVLESS